MNNFLFQKDLILGTALWGWGIDKSKALMILDNFVEKGYRKVDVATNYPINNNYSSYGQTLNWLGEWIRNNSAHPIEVICKVGSLSNTKTNKCNLSKSFLLTSKALINEKLKDSLYCLMIHWDNRSNLDEIKETSNFLMNTFNEGIKVGLSGIKNPKLYYEAAPSLRDKWHIQIKENLINNENRKKYSTIFPKAKYQAYGINMGGLKIDKNEKAISTYLRNINIENSTKEIILNKMKNSILKPEPKSIFDLFISSVYQNKNISEIIIAPSNLKQLNSSLYFINEIKMAHKLIK
tara:strand:- start:8792 stop:9670 length:879 start_codon:yes stop_codon:yes gene_type:complete